MECFRKSMDAFDRKSDLRFNPCCNGMFSKVDKRLSLFGGCLVLILVVMECFRKY